MLEANERLPARALLGETLSATIEDELFIYLEQVSVAPSVTRILITSLYKKLRLFGELRFDANLAFSKSNMDLVNKSKLQFTLADQSRFEVSFPSL